MIVKDEEDKVAASVRKQVATALQNDRTGRFARMLLIHFERASEAISDDRETDAARHIEHAHRTLDWFAETLTREPERVSASGFLSEIGIPARLVNQLNKLGIVEIGDLRDWPRSELVYDGGVTWISVGMIHKRLKDHGFTFWG